MNSAHKKTLAGFMVITSSLGLLLSIFILFQVWHYRQPVADRLKSSLDQFSTVLQTTDEGLGVIDQVVMNVYSSTLYLDVATKAVAQTVQSTNLFMDSAGTFVGEDLITTITNTQSALESAQASAAVIDNILSAISQVPLIGINYNPNLPLNIALGKVSTSLDPLQGSLKIFQTNLKTTQSNMQVFNHQLSILDKNIIAINKNLAQAQTTIDDYRSQVILLKSWAEGAKTNLPAWITTTTWILTMIILWLVFIQISILLQGITLFTPDHQNQEVLGDH